MKSSRLFALAGVTLLAATTLAACSGSGSSTKGAKTFSYIYETDPDNLNYLTTSEGEEYAAVKAQDFVTGLKYAADKKSDALYLVQESIKGLDAYVKGEIKDFSQVGIKALDEQTVQYTLNKPESFWNSKTTMGVLAPVNEEFLNLPKLRIQVVSCITVLIC